MGIPVVRRLRVDLTAPLPRLWCGGDAFRTAFFNALSMSFPAGEQFFIDAVRAGLRALPEAERRRLADEVQGFVGQEATHRRIHALFNAHLARQGHVNAWEGRIGARLERLAGVTDDARHAVALTAANEHLTAVLAEVLLAHPQALAGAEPRLATLWLWHAAEELEHRGTAFDLYRALGGDERRRRRWFALATGYLVSDVLRQTLRNLRHDRLLWRPATWIGAAAFLFGRDGIVRHAVGPWRAYRARDFSPHRHGGERGERWLRDNAAQFVPVNA